MRAGPLTTEIRNKAVQKLKETEHDVSKIIELLNTDDDDAVIFESNKLGIDFMKIWNDSILEAGKL